MKTITKYILFILLCLSVGIGCDKKDSLPIIEEPVIEEPIVEEPVVEEPLPDDAVPPIIRPPIEGPSDTVSIDSIRTLFVGEWEQIARLATEEWPLEVQADTFIIYADGKYTRTIYTNPREIFYQVDSAVLRTFDYYNDEIQIVYGYSYRFYDDKLRLEIKEGLIDFSMNTETILVYKRIK
jgi:hypothetical protein